MHEVYLLVWASVHGRADAVHVPVSRVVAQYPDSQIRGLFQPNATMAEIPPGPREEFLRGRIVHVHAIVIRKDKFHESERVLGTRRLSNEELAGPQLLEYVARDRPWRGHLLAAVYHLKSLFCQVVRIASYARKVFSLCDGIGNIPVRSEYDIRHFLFKHRRAVVVGFPDHDIHCQSDLEFFVIGTKAKLRDIHNDGRLLISIGHPAPAFESQLHLAHTLP